MTSSCDLVWRATLSCFSCQSNAGCAEWSMRVFPTNRMSTDNANVSSAVVKLAEEMTLSSCDMVWSAMLSCLSCQSNVCPHIAVEKHCMCVMSLIFAFFRLLL